MSYHPTEPLLDWSGGPPTDEAATLERLDAFTVAGIERLTEEQIAALHDGALEQLELLKAQVGQGGTVDALGVAGLGIVSFATLDAAARREREAYDAAPDKASRFLHADYLGELVRRAQLAYLDADGNVKPEFSVLHRTGAAIGNLGSGLALLVVAALVVVVLVERR